MPDWFLPMLALTNVAAEMPKALVVLVREFVGFFFPLYLDEGEKKNVLNFPLSKFSTGTLISADSLPCTHPHRHAHTIHRRCHAASGLAKQSKACAACKHPMNFLSCLTLGFVFVCFVFRYSALIQTDCSHCGWNLIRLFCSSSDTPWIPHTHWLTGRIWSHKTVLNLESSEWDSEKNEHFSAITTIWQVVIPECSLGCIVGWVALMIVMIGFCKCGPMLAVTTSGPFLL